ncbi:hypothetical protein CDAR_12091 [Caerostris darwini]|uniref:Uncharacterized protein n=1 Tax=Caerostris darwini TaxID=1538125 RepID=A0AAV4M586_9ARAC|nr:hypothetical protein CDAR_12091 [Caerostris darwini]
MSHLLEPSPNSRVSRKTTQVNFPNTPPHYKSPHRPSLTNTVYTAACTTLYNVCRGHKKVRETTWSLFNSVRGPRCVSGTRSSPRDVGSSECQGVVPEIAASLV